MGRVRPSIARSRVPLTRRIRQDPAALRSWLLLVAGAVLVAASVGHAMGRARAAEARWGHTTQLLVVDGPVAAGDALAGHVHQATWPVGLVPGGALRHLPAGAHARATLGSGTPLTAAAVTDPHRATGRDPDASGRPIVGVAVGAASPALHVGDRVDVWATTDPSLAAGRLTTRRLTERAVVVTARARAVSLAVDPADVADVAGGVATATITLVAVP